MAKKKKHQLKSIPRVFATTSMPKKVVEKEPTPEPEASSVTTEDATASNVPDKLSVAEGGSASHDEFDADQAEEQSLQNLVDKYQDRTEKEIVRTIKSLEQERRFAEVFTKLDVDRSYVDKILDLVLGFGPSVVQKTISEPEDKVIPRLAITFGVLRRLGFSEERVEECLRSIEGIDLEQAYEWLHIHCSEDELNQGAAASDIRYAFSAKGTKTPPTPQIADTDTPPTPLTFTSPLVTPKSEPRHVAKSSIPESGQGSKKKRKGKNSVDPTPPSSNSRLRVIETYDDPTSAYTEIKMQIDELTTHRKPGETRGASVLRDFQQRLKGVMADFLFDEKEAEVAYQAARLKADSDALRAKLRPLITPWPPEELPIESSPTRKPSPPPSPQSSQAVPSEVRSKTVRETGGGLLDGDSDEDAVGGLMDILDQPTEVTIESGVTIPVRDLPAPKQYSGRTPKTLLLEHVSKLDKYAVVMYRDISGGSRAKRAVAQIRWDKGRLSEWSMDDLACRDMSQAEQYISTVALHALSFPPLEGFALGGTAGANSTTSFRLLPPVYRDLWSELEDKRRADDDVTNRGVWAKLRTILEPKLLETRSGFRIQKPVEEVGNKISIRDAGQHGLAPQHIMAGFKARQESAAYQEMLVHRNKLPIAAYRQDVISALETSQILVLSGETGCGKSTQVPAFILEHQLAQGKHCKIYCTEPRRISAISLAQRVSQELGEPAGTVGTNSSIVGYSIRLESNISRTTRLVFATNGIALRMLEGGSGQGGQGTAFDEITHLIIDEVHERTIESDFLLIVLKSLLLERPDLKVVLMSATLDAEKISNYFGGCPILRVPGRTFPVEVLYLEDAIELTQWTVTENSPYAIHGYDKYSRGKARVEWSEDSTIAEDDDDEVDHENNVKLEKRYSSSTAASINLYDERLVPYELIVQLLERICLSHSPYSQYSSAVLVFMPGMGEIRRLHELLMEHHTFGSEDAFKVYPLHSMISSEHQAAVFDIPPPGIRKVVIATNIAETGITIPDITCVIDTGRHREMRFDEKRQLSRLVDTFVAKSNAAQRRGRAGRVRPGLCFHLFTKVRHDNKMADHPDPEMMRLSLSDLALRIKIMKVKLGSSIEDVLSRALDPPSSVNIQRAVSALVEVRALTPTEDITPMGRLLSKLPTDVHLGKFLLIASLFKCLDPALTIAATLSSKSPFLTPFGETEAATRQKLSFKIENSDFLTIHNAFAGWRRALTNGQTTARKFCRTSYLSYQNLQQIEELRQQFLGYLVDSQFIRMDKSIAKELSRARFGRGRTSFVHIPAELDSGSSNVNLINSALCAGLYPKILFIEPKNISNKLTTISNNQQVWFHPSSVNFGCKAREFGVNYLCYFTLMHSKKMYAWETGPVDDLALILLCGEADFKLMSDSIMIDRKIRYRLEPKAAVALKILKNQLNTIISTQFRGSNPLTDKQRQWDELAMTVLGKVKDNEQEQKQELVKLVVNRAV